MLRVWRGQGERAGLGAPVRPGVRREEAGVLGKGRLGLGSEALRGELVWLCQAEVTPEEQDPC